jgi:type II secretory pathway pseudopilin PulG
MVAVAAPPRSAAAGARGKPRGRPAFTLIELMVTAAIIMLLVGVTAAAAAAARGGQKRFKTAADIAKIDAVLRQHFRWVQALRLPGTGGRAALVTGRISGDMPDNWTDVAYMAARPEEFISGPQRAYAGIWKSLQAAGNTPTADVADAECLYMIVMRGGLADCLACGELEGIGIGDTDGDRAMEFLDAWGNPIRFVLWPDAFELPLGQAYFAAGRTRPLIFSAGPDGKGTIAVNAGGNLPTRASNLGGFAAASGSSTDCRRDNVTNFDAEAQR